MNLYIDTRGCSSEPITFTQALVNGLAPGGGLYVPQEIPCLNLEQIVELAQLPYAQRAAAIYQMFDTDLPQDQIDALMKETYGGQFDTPEICPITSLDGQTHVLELWHGPTAAFKDMALQCLPRFFGASAQQLRNQGKLDHEFMILVATSGDTGSAALEGFADVPGVRIGVMYPQGGVSDIQYKQMATMCGANTQVWAVTGNFDDCQSGAKAVFGDAEYAATLKAEHGVALSSANSINWGRLLPQVVYYISAYGQLVRMGKVEAGQPIDVCVPTGNFGNILAAWYARRMGTPIARLICASNQNRVLTDFIATGVYDIANREFVLTPSPSMDILISSNLERQLFELSGRNAQAVAEWMASLAKNRRFEVDAQTLAAVQEVFAAGWASNGECLQTIREVLDAKGYLLDPHTAVAYRVAQQQRGENPVLIASTAHWAKFGPNVYRAIHGMAAGDVLPAEVEALTGCELNELIAREAAERALASVAPVASAEERANGADAAGMPANASAPASAIGIPQALAGLDGKPIRFRQVIDPAVPSIEQAVTGFLQK